MALATTFIVVPFIAGLKNRLVPGTPRRMLTRASGIAAAESLAPFYAGVMVLLDRADPIAGVFHEPLLICAIGDVPGDLVHQLAA